MASPVHNQNIHAYGEQEAVEGAESREPVLVQTALGSLCGVLAHVVGGVRQA